MPALTLLLHEYIILNVLFVLWRYVQSSHMYMDSIHMDKATLLRLASFCCSVQFLLSITLDHVSLVSLALQSREWTSFSSLFLSHSWFASLLLCAFTILQNKFAKSCFLPIPLYDSLGISQHNVNYYYRNITPVVLHWNQCILVTLATQTTGCFTVLAC